MGGAVLITAGAYVGAELAAEFGRLPPSFLPVGNRRLFVHQHDQLKGGFDRILMSLPADFEPGAHDRALLEALGIELIFVARGLDLSSSILAAIAEAGLEGGPLAILHGDTLIFEIDYGVPDSVSAANTSESYQWAGGEVREGRLVRVIDVLPGETHDGPVLSGYFHFADLNHLILSLAASRGNFVTALDRYVAKRPMVPLSSNRWLDFGHIHTYYISRGSMTTERAFNALRVERRSVLKQSSRADRIEAESHWYEALPAALRIYLPQYLGRMRDGGQEGYGLEFLYLASLADLFVFGTLNEPTWARILSSCADFLHAAGGYAAPEGAVADPLAMYLPKTLKRLEEFGAANGLDLDRPWRINGVETLGLRQIAQESAERIAPPTAQHLTVIHGDPCFSNILYDFRSHSVRLIDPRGQDAEGRPTIWGDNRYDLAKLHHSVIGLYDMILAGYCAVEDEGEHAIRFTVPDTAGIAAAQAAFERVLLAPFAADRQSIEAISLHLFLSMLPLHSDSPERQRALLANALRLYVAQKGAR
ncbi:hypothetical protein FHS31_001596 [Sphingomonas vulcanisoli]|uniref:Capsular biosynthesis protein n=1 Tax=Sphingomonas vulcanisoli TaxID=1658060 RepID=A0ABX0TRB2_9SPHN|nr:capsular biosynthesis protein [Sphingomonas vulcanisoli]NIJ07986.1 hypothetical protein [Sphingomonas vulcanisoli]